MWYKTYTHPRDGDNSDMWGLNEIYLYTRICNKYGKNLTHIPWVMIKYLNCTKITCIKYIDCTE